MGSALRAYGARAGLRKVMTALVLLSPTTVMADQITIAALGDSLTQGYGLVEAEGFVPQLQAWLQTEGQDVRLINAGVSGDTTAGGLARVAWTLGDDVDGVIVALGANDVLRGIDPAVSRANLSGILSQISEKRLPILLVGIPAPANYGPDYKHDFDAIYPELSAQFGTHLFENFLSGLGSGEDLSAVQALMQGDGIHPNAQGVKKIVAAMGPVVLNLANDVRELTN